MLRSTRARSALTSSRSAQNRILRAPAAAARRGGVGVLVVSALALPATGGCGGGSDQTTAQPPDPALVRSVDAACRRYKVTITRSSQRFEATLHRAGAAGAVEATADRYRADARRTARLGRKVESIAGADATPELERWLEITQRRSDAQRALADGLDRLLAESAIAELQDELRGQVEAARDAVAGTPFAVCAT